MNRRKKPEWLTRVQEHSYEPEILISGVILFALLQIPAELDRLQKFLQYKSFSVFYTSNIDEFIIVGLKIAVVWLIIGFTVHLIFRSIWIAFVGLSYVFPQGINIKKLKLSGRYQQKILNLPSFTQSVQKLERICSMIFASIFLFFMAAIGIIVYNICLGLVFFALFVIFPFLQAYNQEVNYLLLYFVIITVGLYLIDFLSLGYLKRIPYFRKFYYPIYQLMSIITLAPLYRSIYYGLVSNLNRFYIFIGLFLYTAATFFIAYIVFDSRNIFVEYNTLGGEKMVYAGHYQNLYEENPSNVIQIQSDVVKEQVLRVFIVYNTWHYQYFDGKYDWQQYEDIASIPDSVLFANLNQEFVLQIDSAEDENRDWFRYNQDKTNQYGFLTWMDISHLDRGPHLLKFIRFQTYSWADTIKVDFFKESAKLSPAVNSTQTELNEIK